MASVLLLHPPFISAPQTPLKSNSFRNPNPRPSIRSPVVFSLSSSDLPPSWEREEQRWLREEQRWLREEQRWLREEQRWLREEQRWIREEKRWSSERESLLRQVSDLRLRIDAIENSAAGPSVSDLASLLRTMKGTDVDVKPSADKERITDGGAGPRPMLLEEAEVKEVVLEEVRVLKEGKEARTIRKGSEGDDVRAMQEALQRLGFYSGEEDMEFSSYSSGTERAVKTWQASVGIPQDGIMTVDILKKLFHEQRLMDADQNVERKDSTNGAVVASVTELSEIERTIVKDNGVTEVEVSQHRVFLLGENRWEEPSRLVGRNKPSGEGKLGAATKCLTCRGEGRLMCTECDGTGEPNIEPQFMEWVDDGAKCPYCEGLGYTICDVCEGKTITPSS